MQAGTTIQSSGALKYCSPVIRAKALDAYLGCEVYLKAECMQATGAFKLRGAMNKLLSLSAEELSHGIVAASSGNHGRAVAYSAKMLGTKATIVMPKTAPDIKVNAIRELDAEVVLCETAERFRIADQICKERQAAMVPPYNDEAIMAGQGTIGLELLEQCPEVNAVVIPVSGGGLIGGVSTAIKAAAPHIKVYGAEPDAVPRYSVSLAAGQPTTVEQHTSVADALVSNTPGSICFPQVKANVDRVAAVSDTYLLRAMKLLLTEAKILAEPSSCIGLGAVLQGLLPVTKEMKLCFVLSGGNVGLEQLDLLKEVTL